MKVQELLDTIKNITKYTGMESGSRDRIREVIRCYYNHTCQKCFKKWEEGTRRFDIHHKDCKKYKTKQIDRNEDLNNLIILCHNCHFSLDETKSNLRVKKNKTLFSWKNICE